MSEAIEVAKMHLQNAETWAHRDEYDRSQSAALVGIGFALIGIGEALEREPKVEVLQVNSRIPEAYCGETTAHDEHTWTTEDASPFSPSTSLRRCRGASVTHVPST